jgi:uncharacterized protein RhaS with RHS repeats
VLSANLRNTREIQGRWISPDPAGLIAVDPANPQTWNRYAYVANNPMSAVDPTGLLLMDCAWDGCPHNNAGGYYVQIPAEADQHSWVIPITIPA